MPAVQFLFSFCFCPQANSCDRPADRGAPSIFVFCFMLCGYTRPWLLRCESFGDLIALCWRGNARRHVLCGHGSQYVHFATCGINMPNTCSFWLRLNKAVFWYEVHACRTEHACMVRMTCMHCMIKPCIMFASHLGQTSFEVTLQAAAVRHAGPHVDAAVLSHPSSRSLGCHRIMRHFQMVPPWQQKALRVAAP